MKAVHRGREMQSCAWKTVLVQQQPVCQKGWRARHVISSCGSKNTLVFAHEGHVGMRAMRRRIRDMFWWPDLDRDVEHWVRECFACALSDKSQVTVPSPVEAVPFPEKPWVKLGMDIIGSMNMLREGQRYGIVLVDYCYRWPEVKFVQNANTSEVITFLCELLMREGAPMEIITNNGVQFKTDEFIKFMKKWEVVNITTSLYHPRSNGLVERCNRVIKDNIQLSLVSGLEWRNELEDLIWALRTTPCASTGLSPFCVLKGRVAANRLVRPWMCDNMDGCGNLSDVNTKRKSAQDKYVSKECSRLLQVKIGDMVCVKLPGIIGKGHSKFSGPKRVVCVKTRVVQLDDGRWWNKEKLAIQNKFVNSGNDTMTRDFPDFSSSKQECIRSSRVKKRPQWLCDYVP